MADKKKLSTTNPLLGKWPEKGTSSFGNLSLTSNFLSGQSSLSKSSNVGKELKSSFETKLKTSTGASQLTSGTSSSPSSNLTNSLLSSTSLGLSAKPNLLLSSPSLLKSSFTSSLKPSSSLGLSAPAVLKTGFSPLKQEKPQHIESSLTKLSLSQSPEKATRISPRGLHSTSDPSKISRKRGLGSHAKAEKKKMVESSTGLISAKIIKQHAIEPPDYSYEIQPDGGDDFMETDIPKFIPYSKDMRLTMSVGKSLTDVNGIKTGLINCVSGSLISQPNFSNKDDMTREQITVQVETVIHYDPEFILKVALYSRKELNIRTTSNFLLALAANSDMCRQFLKKYFCACIALPSDWIEVAEIFQTLEENNLKRGSLPAALRKSMITKFSEFDQYQLAKYNKDSSGKKKKSKEKKAMQMKNKKEEPNKKGSGRRLWDSDSSDSEDEASGKVLRQVSNIFYDEKESEEVIRKQRFTMKQLIRKLHIKEPVEHVMCIIGKKYPSTMEEFYRSRLPGTFDEDKAGKRMKLPVPETWETQVSLKGNKAKTWEDLIDHKKLPYMAMLRNLRNLIKAGISPKHHNFVLRRLCDQRSVVNSKQFPFRFFSAYVVLNELEEAYEKNQKDIIEKAEAAATAGGFKQDYGGKKRGGATLRGRGGARGARGAGNVNLRGGVRGRGVAARGRAGQRGRGRGGSSGGDSQEFKWWVLKKMKKDEKEGGEIKEVAYNKNLIDRYRKALDTAVKVATVHNVQPIKGKTILLCDMRESMDVACGSAKGLGKPRTRREIAVLMGLMCKYSCEDCELLLFYETGFKSIELLKGTILDNMEKVLSSTAPTNADDMVEGLPYPVLLEKLRDRVQVDNLLIFGEDIYPDSNRGLIIGSFLRSYRHVVNPNLLYVSVSFTSPKPGFKTSITPEHCNDIYISGYSDAILRFIAERGNEGQVNHVDKIDLAFKLRPMPKVKTDQQEVRNVPKIESGLQLTATTPSWRTVRVFISSTFRDMHGERDLLTRFVFPELRSLGRKHFINIHEVDLRWGVTEEQAKDNRTIEVCLQEVARSQLFVGLLGERYGWVPETYCVPDTPEYDWVRQYSPGASVTELEMHLGALSRVNEAKEKAFFYFRDPSFEKDIPEVFQKDFKPESEAHRSKMAALKKRIRNSGLEVYDNYPCHWGGCLEGKPLVAGLGEFGARILTTLENAIKKICPDEDHVLTEEEHINNLQWTFVESCSADFVGRKTLVTQIISRINSMAFGTIGLIGKAGCGKTALMASAIMQYVNAKHVDGNYSVLINMAGSAPGSNNLSATLRRLAHQINLRFGLGQSLPEDFKNLSSKLKDLLEDAANVCTSRLVVFLDGVDLMDSANQPASLEWMPNPVPANVVFVITAVDAEKTHKSLKRLGAAEINVGGLDMWDKADLVRQTLAKHRKVLNESGFGNQMKLLMLKKDAHNPLYLKLACEELRVFGVFERISDKLKSLPHTTAQMLQEILTRLEEDHGQSIVCISLCLLACSRDGLYPEELHELLNYYKLLGQENFEPGDINNTEVELKDQIPQLTFTFLARTIMGFLNPSSSWALILSLGNREICTAVRLRYLKGTDISLETKLHKLLAGFFLKKADPMADNSWQSQNSRAFSEFPYHMTCGGNFQELEETLCNHKFIQAKCSLGLAATLMDDFAPKVLSGNRQQEVGLSKFLALPRVQQYKSFVSRNIEVLVSYPSLELQQALNEPSDSIPFKDALTIRETHTGMSSYMEWLNKPETESQCYMTLSNFKTPATCIAVSPDSSKFATGSKDLMVRLYEMSTGKEICAFSGHSDEITDVCFVGHNMLCSASVDSSLSIWDVENRHRIRVLSGHSRRVNTCAADSKGKVIASGGWDCSVNIWKADSGDKVCVLDTGSPVNCVDFHPSEERVVVGCWDSLIRIYNVFHKTRIAVLRGHSTSVRDIAYSMDGRHLSSAALDGDIKVWAADLGSQIGSIKGHDGPISKLTFSRTGKELITAGEDHQIKVWSGDLGIPLHRLHTDSLGAATSVCISPTGISLAVGYHLGYVRIYDVLTGVRLSEIKLGAEAIRAISYTQDGSYVIAGCDIGVSQVLEGIQGSKVTTLIGHSKAVLCVTTSKSFVATGAEDCTCCIYEDIRRLKSSKQAKPSCVLTGHIAPVTACTFNQDETMIATTSRDASIRIYVLREAFISSDPQPTNILHSCHADWINSCQWSNTGNYLVTASNDFNLKVWDTKTGKEKNTITGHTSAVNSVAYKFGCIVSGSSDGDVKVWSHKGVPITTLCGHTLRVNSCDIYVKLRKKASYITEKEESSEMNWAEMANMEVDDEGSGKKASPPQSNVNVEDVLVASAGDDGAVWLWKPLQANNLACLTGHSDRVLSVSADKQNRIASCSLDCSLRLWQPQLNEGISLNKHSAPVTFVTVFNNGLRAISGSRDGVIKIWVKDEGQVFQCKHSYQAHEKSINCCCFSGKTAEKFMTGGDDNCIHIWEMSDRKNGIYIRKEKTIETNMPVSSLLSFPGSEEVCFATWSGVVFTGDGKRPPKIFYDCLKIHDEITDYRSRNTKWPASMVHKLNTREIIMGTTCGSVVTVKIPTHDGMKVSEGQEIEFSRDNNEVASAIYGKPENWVRCVVTEGNLTFAGDSYGQIMVTAPEVTTIDKIHKSSINAIAVVGDTVFTGSSDCSIKVWNYSQKLSQIGQFFNPSPVLTLKVASVRQDRLKNSITLLAGDLLGNIQQLEWQP